MISINSYFSPFRLEPRDRKPVELAVELVNRYGKEKNLNVEVSLSRGLSFDLGGFKGIEKMRIDGMKPMESKKIYFSIYAKPFIESGEHPIQIKVKEQMEGYADPRYIAKEFTKNMELKVK
ncbi:MAG: hypothetical protein ABIE23_06395 [archaeon]